MLPYGYSEKKSNESHDRDIEDLENRINKQSKNLETLKKICEDLYAKVAELESKMFHLSNSTMMTALEVEKLTSKNKVGKKKV